MANENNKNEELAGVDDDPTSEMEALTWRRPDILVSSDTLEAEANTIDFAKLQTSNSSDTDDHVLRLQYELEKQRALQSGMQAEIVARDEIAKNLNESLARLQRKLEKSKETGADKTKTIRQLKREIRERNSEYKEALDDLQALRGKADDKSDQVDSASAQLALATEQVAELARQVESQASSIDALENSEKSLRDDLAAALQLIDELSTTLEDNQEVLQSRDNEIAALREAAAPNELAQQNAPNIRALLASKERELDDMAAAYRRNEEHTDLLRQRSQDALDENDRISKENASLLANLADARREITEKDRSLEAALQRIEELEHDAALLVERHDEEIRMVRFELGEAQSTLSENELINEQLASDLVQTRGFKESLEQMLTHNEEHSQATVAGLERQLKSARDSISQLEQSLETKNEAINCLLAELAAKRESQDASRPAASRPPVVMDEFSQDVDFRLPDSDRVSRYLIGEVDGQDVQFPLFKGRLTIGRTQANDIQLTADYISRRHAVLVTEQDVTRIIDWGSRNGVFVNSRRITEHFLSSGDKVTIGTFDFLYEERKRPDKT